MNTIKMAKASISSIIASGVALLCHPLAANDEFDPILGLVAAEAVAGSGVEAHLDIKDIPRNLNGAADDDRMMQSLNGFTLLGLRMAGYAIFRDQVCVGFRINSEELAPDAVSDVAGVFMKSVASVTDVMGKGILLDDVPWGESGSEVMLSEVAWFHTNEVVVVSHQRHAGDPQGGRITFSREAIRDFAADTGIATNDGDLASYYRDELEWDIARAVSLRWEKMQAGGRAEPGRRTSRGEASNLPEPRNAGDPMLRNGSMPTESEAKPTRIWLVVTIVSMAVVSAILLFRMRNQSQSPD